MISSYKNYTSLFIFIQQIQSLIFYYVDCFYNRTWIPSKQEDRKLHKHMVNKEYN